MGDHMIPGASDPHGAAQHTDVTREIFLPANEAYIKTGTADQRGIIAAVKGGANLDEPTLLFGMTVPDDFVSFTKVEATWLCGSATGDMYWNLNAQYFASGEIYTTHEDGPLAGVTATGGANLANVQEPANPLTLANLGAGDYIGIQLARTGSNALDTLDAVVYFIEILFTYVAEQ